MVKDETRFHLTVSRILFLQQCHSVNQQAHFSMLLFGWLWNIHSYRLLAVTVEWTGDKEKEKFGYDNRRISCHSTVLPLGVSKKGTCGQRR